MAPPERLLAAVAEHDAETHLRALDESGELTALLPELERGRGFTQPALHHYNVLDHSFAAVGALARVLDGGEAEAQLRGTLPETNVDAILGETIDGRPLLHLLRLACLVHDIAKPATATEVEGRLRFPRHGPRGAALLREALPDIGFGDASVAFVATMVRYHLRPGEFVRSWPPTDRALRRFSRDVGGRVLPLMLLQLADGMATRGPAYTAEHYQRHCRFLGTIVMRTDEADTTEEAPLISGEEAMRALGLPSGRLLGAVLTSVREAQRVGEVTTRDEALALARDTLADLTSCR